MDLHERESLTAGAATVLDDWGRIDVLVNNAVDTGPGSMTTVADTTLDDYQRKLEGNFLAQLVLIHAVLPHLLERGEGTIVDITSAAGITDPPAPAGEGGWGLAYAASKAAFHRVAAHLAVEFGPRGVLAFNVEPGMVMTEKMAINQKAMGLENKFPVAPPSVPAAVVAWLCTDPEAADHNGETFTAQKFAKDRGLHQPTGGDPPQPAVPRSSRTPPSALAKRTSLMAWWGPTYSKACSWTKVAYSARRPPSPVGEPARCRTWP